MRLLEAADFQRTKSTILGELDVLSAVARIGPKELAVTLPDGRKRCADPPKADAALRAPEIARLFREHNRALVLYLASRFKDVQSAREVAQEAYVRLLRRSFICAFGGRVLRARTLGGSCTHEHGDRHGRGKIATLSAGQ